MSPGREHDLAVAAAFVREGVKQTDSPVVEAARFVGHPVLAHDWVLAAAVGEVGAGAARDADLLRLPVQRLRMQDRLLQAGRRLELVEIVGRVDHHLHANALALHLAQPLGKERHVEDQDHVGGAERLQRALALADRRHADAGPARDGVDAHLVDVEAHFLGRGEGGLDVLAAGAEVADDGDGLAGSRPGTGRTACGTARSGAPG